MSDIHNDIDYIDRFLRGELSAEEQESYTKRLQDDPAFRNLHEEQKFVMEGIAYASRREIKKQLNTIENELQDEEAPAVVPHRSYYRNIAAGLLLLIACVSIYYIYTSYNHHTRLYEAYFNPPSSFEIPRTRGTNFAVKAADAYNNKDFKTAEQQFDRALQEQSTQALLYYQGLTKMQLQKFDEAENLFKTILAGNHNFHPQAHWYLALIYIKAGRSDEAVPHLQKLASSNNNFRNPAKGLLDDL